jgi:hypothetical protein
LHVIFNGGFGYFQHVSHFFVTLASPNRREA